MGFAPQHPTVTFQVLGAKHVSNPEQQRLPPMLFMLGFHRYSPSAYNASSPMYMRKYTFQWPPPSVGDSSSPVYMREYTFQ
jgi:hypothetical protein